MSKIYLLDANVLIEAKRRYCAIDFCPGFWECLVSAHSDTSNVFSVDHIKDELLEGKDEIAEWITDVVPDSFFQGCDSDPVIKKYAELNTWVNGNAQFSPAAKAEFATVADAWLIASAGVNNFTVVTQEIAGTGSKKRVKIPDVCQQFSISFVDTFTMLRELGGKFSWKCKPVAKAPAVK